MAFKPEQSGNRGGDFEPFVTVVPKAGNRYARLSLIVDMGKQEREDFVDEKTGETRPQQPCQQVALFADLVKDVVDYGGEIGEKQYRMLLNKSFKGEVSGVNFTTTAPKDAKGNLIKGKPWGFHPVSMLTKLAKAVDMEEIIYESDAASSLDIELLLDEPFMLNVEIKETVSKDKKDKDNKPLVYKNVNFKGASPVPEDVEVPDMDAEAKSITFTNATKEDIVFIRSGLLKQIKKALNYEGSQMQKAIEEFEAEKATAADRQENGPEEKEEASEPETPTLSKAEAKKAAKAAGKPAAETQAPAAPKAEAKPVASKAAAKTTKAAAKAKPAVDPEDEDCPF